MDTNGGENADNKAKNPTSQYKPYSPIPVTPTTYTPASLQGPEKKTFGQHLLEWVKIIVIAIAIALPIRLFIAEPFIVNGASMDPTFSTGQFLIVDRVSYRFEKPERGDVIVFEYPGDKSTYFIKRIIGLPGETVMLQDGKVYIQNVGGSATSSEIYSFDEPYIDPAHASRDTITEPKLGPTEYFVMGDNRSQSSDSRVWGPLDKKLIIGRPIVRLTPLNQISVFPGQNHEIIK